MVVTPEQLLDRNNPVYLNEISRLEFQIDSWLQQHFAGKRNIPIPLLVVDEPRKIVQAQIIEKYANSGWELSFEATEMKTQVAIRIVENSPINNWDDDDEDE